MLPLIVSELFGGEQNRKTQEGRRCGVVVLYAKCLSRIKSLWRSAT